MADMMSRVARSWQLIKASRDVLSCDRALLMLPLMSGAAMVLLMGTLAALLMSSGTLASLQAGQNPADFGVFYVWLFAWYLVQYFVVIFFNTALIGAAIEVLDGRRPTVDAALALALRRIGPILGYAVISATVGVLLNAIAERLGVIGRWIEGALGLAWAAATFLVVPILAAEGIGPVQAITRSATLLRKTWGENLIGNAGITLVMSMITGAIGLIGCGGGSLLFKHGHAVLGVAVFSGAVTLFLLVMLVGSALSAIYAAAVYYYAVVGAPPQGFEPNLIRGAFVQKRA